IVQLILFIVESKNIGIVSTEMELIMEQTQQGISHEVSVSVEGVEELKRKVKIKGERKKPSYILGRNWVNTSIVRNTKPLSGIEENRHRPNDAMHNPSQPLKVRKTLFQNSRRFTHFNLLSHSELAGFDQITNKDAIILYSLANEVNMDYAKLIWEDIITKLNKKTKEKFVPYTRFLSFLLEHKMEGYRNDNVTLNPTQVFSVHNWALKKNQHEGPPFTAHMLAICNTDVPVEHKAPNTSSYTRKKDSKGKRPGAKSGHRKQPTSSKHHPLSKIKTTKVAGLHKKDQQATGGPTYLGVTSEEGSNPQLSSGMSTFIHHKPIYSTSTIIHYESASRCDVLPDFTTEADPRKYAPNDSISKKQDIDGGTHNYLIHHIFAGTNPHVLVEQTKYASEGLEIVLTKPATGNGSSHIEQQIEEELNTSPDLSSLDDAKIGIKLEALSKLVKKVEANFMDPDSPKNEPMIDVDESEEEADKTEDIHATSHPYSEDTSVLKPSSPSNSLPTELKELPFKFNKLSREVKELKKHVHDLEIKLPRDLKEIPNKLETFTSIVESLTTQVAEMKTLQWELTTEFLFVPINVASIKAKIKTFDTLLSQAGTQPIEGEKNTNQVTISQLFQRKSAKDAEKANINKQQSIPTPPPNTTTITSSTTSSLQSPFLPKDGTDEVIPKFEASDLHPAEWKELVQAYPNRAGKGRTIIYEQINTILDYLHQTEAELGIDLNKPLSKQDPLDKLNELAKKKKKHADDIHDYFR
nr:hypothetical protein [Tanacetum cinerariifolium]